MFYMQHFGQVADIYALPFFEFFYGYGASFTKLKQLLKEEKPKTLLYLVHMLPDILQVMF